MTTREEAGKSGELTPDQHLGNFVRKYRLKQRLILADVSARAGISRGMLSKIENGQTSASLSTLTKVARALGVTLSTMFSNYDVPVGGAQHVKAGQGIEVVRRGTKRGHTYHLLAYDRGPAHDVVRGKVLALARPPGFLWPASLPGASVASRHPARPRGHDDSSIRRGRRLRERAGQQFGLREHRMVAGRQLNHAIRTPREPPLRLGWRRPVLGAHHVGRGLLPPRDGAGGLPEGRQGWRVRRSRAPATASSSQSCMKASGANSAFMPIVASSWRGSIHGPGSLPRRNSPTSRPARASRRSRIPGAERSPGPPPRRL